MSNSYNIENPRWFALVNDGIVTAPRKTVPVSLLMALASVDKNDVLVRDHQSPNDVPLNPDHEINLAEGNVFITKRKCDAKSSQPTAPAKMALAVDDRFELIQVNNISREIILMLFELESDCLLFRDFESPNDQEIKEKETVLFTEGPAFYTKTPSEIIIIVNGREKMVSKSKLTYEEVVSCAFPKVNLDKTIYTITYKKGPVNQESGSLVKGKTVCLKGGMIFNVTPTDKS